MYDSTGDMWMIPNEMVYLMCIISHHHTCEYSAIIPVIKSIIPFLFAFTHEGEFLVSEAVM